MRINCVSCGHKVDLDEAYDNYEGEVKCFACSAILEIKAVEANLRSVTLVRTAARRSSENSGK
ncbi:MAG: hypothetical protein HY315_00750 [Acidobacteria bacterium]|nr:hypothetical protein [Acidobacteriota bacterium]